MSIQQQQQQFWDETNLFWELLSKNINFKANGVKSLEEIKTIIMNNHINEELIREECDVGCEWATGYGFNSLWEMFMGDGDQWGDESENMKIGKLFVNNKETKLVKWVYDEEDEEEIINNNDKKCCDCDNIIINFYLNNPFGNGDRNCGNCVFNIINEDKFIDINEDDMEYIMGIFVEENKLNMLFNEPEEIIEGEIIMI